MITINPSKDFHLCQFCKAQAILQIAPLFLCRDHALETLSRLADFLNPDPANSKWGVIAVSSGYGGNTRQPFVELRAAAINKPLQIAPEAARDLAHNLIDCAEVADQDAFLYEFISNEIMGDGATPAERDHYAAGVIQLFRQYRIDHGLNK
jgi:hypothetical protein